jgi:hypothetical protein
MGNKLYFCYNTHLPVTYEEAVNSHYRPILEFSKDTEVVLKSNGCTPSFYKDGFTKQFYNGEWVDSFDKDVFPIRNPSYTKLVWSKGCEYKSVADIDNEIYSLNNRISKLMCEVESLELKKAKYLEAIKLLGEN